jgi:hypothetical protein
MQGSSFFFFFFLVSELSRREANFTKYAGEADGPVLLRSVRLCVPILKFRILQ